MNQWEADVERLVGEDDLHSYVDHALEPVRYEQVQAHLVCNPDDAAKVQAYEVQNLELRSRFEMRGVESPNLRIAGLAVELERKFQEQRRFGRLVRASAASVLFVSAIWTGWNAFDSLRPEDKPGQEFARQAAVAYRLFALDTNDVAENESSDRSRVVSWLSQRVAGVPSQAPDLTAAGYWLAKDRVLSPEANPAALLVYEHYSGGQPLTLYIGKRVGPRRKSMVYSRVNDVSMVYWQAGPLAYSLVGRIDRKTLQRLAGDVDEQFRVQPPSPKRFARQSPEPKPKNIGAEPIRAEPAVVRPGKADNRDAVDEPRSMLPRGPAQEKPGAKPVSGPDSAKSDKT